jgi:hypothetical protein
LKKQGHLGEAFWKKIPARADVGAEDVRAVALVVHPHRADLRVWAWGSISFRAWGSGDV